MNHLAIAAQGSIKVVDIDSNDIVQTFNTTDPVSCVCFGNCGDLLAAAYRRRSVIELFQTGSGETKQIPTHKEPVVILFSRSDEYLLWRLYGGNIVIWNLEQEQIIHTFSCPSANAVAPSVCYSKNGNRLIASHTIEIDRRLSYGLTVFDIENGVECFSVSGFDRLVRSITICSTHDHMATGSNDRTVKIYDSNDYSFVFQSQTFKSPVSDVLYLPDGAKLVAAMNSEIVIFDSIAYSELLVFSFSTADPCKSVSVNASGTRIALTSIGQANVRLYDAETGMKVLCIDASLGSLVCFARPVVVLM